MLSAPKLLVAILLLVVMAAACSSGDVGEENTTPAVDTATEAPEEEPDSTDGAPLDDGDTEAVQDAEPTGSIPATATGCEALLDAFAGQPEANARCEDGMLRFESDGLGELDPEERELSMMVGITAWILRVPIPFDYQWSVPAEPVWLDEFAEASPRGPIAVAVDGVPIFHYEARPDASTHPEHYDPRTDTVVQGELDHCGGHAGQGDDYHYHYAPVCLVDDHDLSHPIAFGLDGAPVLYGTGGTDYYGFGYFNDINMLPNEELDDCNAIQLADGSWVHYTTAEPPYLIGCHHGVVDQSLQIEPSAMRAQRTPGAYGGEVGEPSQTLVTDWYVDDEGWMHLEHTTFGGDGTSATLYRQADGDDCWEFDFREQVDVAGLIETYCRAS